MITCSSGGSSWPGLQGVCPLRILSGVCLVLPRSPFPVLSMLPTECCRIHLQAFYLKAYCSSDNKGLSVILWISFWCWFEWACWFKKLPTNLRYSYSQTTKHSSANFQKRPHTYISHLHPLHTLVSIVKKTLLICFVFFWGGGGGGGLMMMILNCWHLNIWLLKLRILSILFFSHTLIFWDSNS